MKCALRPAASGPVKLAFELKKLCSSLWIIVRTSSLRDPHTPPPPIRKIAAFDRNQSRREANPQRKRIQHHLTAEAKK